jgi:hypothetical protein
LGLKSFYFIELVAKSFVSGDGLAETKSTRWIKFISHSLQMLLLTVMALLLPMAPFACAALSGQAHFLRQYVNTVKRSASSLGALHRANVIARYVERTLTEQWWPSSAAPQETIHGDCTHCGRCCLDRTCVFLDWTDDGLSRCSIHNNWFWKLTSCGKYPIDSPSIAVYNCPSFKAVPVRVAVRLPDRGPAHGRPHTR